jgi:uncharacterized membrane protein YraQ (UPF0718 family)
MLLLYSLATIALILSAIQDRKKTIKSLKTAWKVFIKILPLLLVSISLVSIILYILPDYVIAQYLDGAEIHIGIILGALLGSISLLPGFITFPLSGLLLKQGVSYTVLASFTTTLMMVGIVTFPVEKEIFGVKISIARNIAGFLIAIIISLVIGFVYGEISL